MRETLHGIVHEIRAHRGTRKGIEQEAENGIVGAKAVNEYDSANNLISIKRAKIDRILRHPLKSYFFSHSQGWDIIIKTVPMRRNVLVKAIFYKR